jgi:HlyD family secretion protein
MTRNRWLALGAVVLLVVAVYFGYDWWNQRNATADVEEEFVVVARGTLQESVGGTGAVAPADEVSLAFANGGLVEEVLVAEGDEVSADQPLAVLDTRELTLSLAAAEASLASAESGLLSAQASLRDLLDGPDAAELEAAKIKLESAKDGLWATQARRDGTCGRVDNGRGEQYECDSAEASVLQGEGSVRSAQLEYDEVLAGATESEIISARDKVTQAESQVASAKSQYEQARLKLEDATLVSPIDGTVLELNLREGESVGSSDAAIVIADLSAMQVEINLDETDIAAVEAGSDALITLDAFPDDELTGSVASIAIAGSTESGVVLYPVTVSVESTDLPVRPGMTADVEIITMSVENVLKIPARAVVSTPRGDFVALALPEGESDLDGSAGGEGFDRSQLQQMDPERLAAMRERGGARGAMLGLTGSRMVQVTLGAESGSEVEVVSGLSEGDVVVVPQLAAASSSAEPGFGPPPGGEFRMMGGVIRGGR